MTWSGSVRQSQRITMPDNDYDALADLLGEDSIAAILGAIQDSSGFKNRELDQAWKIAQLGESGANTRAGISAGASRYSADAGVKSSRIAAEASKYGVDVGRLTDQERIGLDRELGRAGIGVDLLKTAASLSGPSNYLDYVSLLRGGRELGGMPYFLGGITGEKPLAGFQAPGGSPTPLTMDSLLRGLGAAGSGGVTSDGGTPQEHQANAFKDRVGSLLSGGPHQFAAGSLERLNPSELGLLQGAAGEAGYNWDDIVTQYRRSGIGQGDAMAG
jgi:hypothetical protein